MCFVVSISCVTDYKLFSVYVHLANYPLVQNEWMVDGARVLGIDAASEMVFVSGKTTSLGGEHLLSKVKL